MRDKPGRLSSIEERPRRYKVVLDATVTYDLTDDEKSIVGKGFNISHNGMAIFADRQLAVGTLVQVAVRMKDRWVQLNGIIRNRSSVIGSLMKYGIAFRQGAEAQRASLVEYCARIA